MINNTNGALPTYYLEFGAKIEVIIITIIIFIDLQLCRLWAPKPYPELLQEPQGNTSPIWSLRKYF